MRTVTFLAIALVISISTFAQDNGDKEAKIQKRAEVLTQKMDSALNLSDDQESKILELNTKRITSLAEARKIEDEAAKKTEVRAQMKQYNDALKGILDEEQYKKFVEIRKALKEEAKEEKKKRK